MEQSVDYFKTKKESNENYDKMSQVKCNKCGDVLLKKSLNKHMRYKHEGLRHYCDACDFQCANKIYLLEHIKTNFAFVVVWLIFQVGVNTSTQVVPVD